MVSCFHFGLLGTGECWPLRAPLRAQFGQTLQNGSFVPLNAHTCAACAGHAPRPGPLPVSSPRPLHVCAVTHAHMHMQWPCEGMRRRKRADFKRSSLHPSFQRSCLRLSGLPFAGQRRVGDRPSRTDTQASQLSTFNSQLSSRHPSAGTHKNGATRTFSAM